MSQDETPYSGSGAPNFSAGQRERLRALGLDLAPLPWGEYQRRHCHNKSYFLCRCCEVNPAICCVSQQRSVGMFFLAGKEHFSAGITLSNIHSQLYLPICRAEDSLPGQWNCSHFCFVTLWVGTRGLRVPVLWRGGRSVWGEPPWRDPNTFPTLYSSTASTKVCWRLSESRHISRPFPLNVWPHLLPTVQTPRHGQRCGRRHPAAAAARPAAPPLLPAPFPLGKSLDNLLFKWTSRTFAMVTYFSQWRILKRIVCKRSSVPYRCPSPLPSLPPSQKRNCQRCTTCVKLVDFLNSSPENG